MLTFSMLAQDALVGPPFVFRPSFLKLAPLIFIDAFVVLYIATGYAGKIAAHQPVLRFDTPVRVVLSLFLIAVDLSLVFFLYIQLRVTLEKKPILTIDERGWRLHFLTSSFVPWSQISQIAVLGKGTNMKLGLVLRDTEKTLLQIPKAVQSTWRSQLRRDGMVCTVQFMYLPHGPDKLMAAIDPFCREMINKHWPTAPQVSAAPDSNSPPIRP